MDRSNVIYLISETQEQNDFGLYVPTETKREVFCDVRSITQTEWFEAGRNGINPAYVFVINRNEYNNELIVEFNGERYGAYRTYAGRNETLELYCEAKGGLVVNEYENRTEPITDGDN